MKTNIFTTAFYALAVMAAIHFVYGGIVYKFWAWHILGIIAIFIALGRAHKEPTK